MEWGEFVKVFGPLAIGWVIAGFLGKWILDRMDKWLERDLKTALALEALTTAIKDKLK